MQNVPIEALVMVVLVLLWAALALCHEKHCPHCGRPEKDCSCHWH